MRQIVKTAGPLAAASANNIAASQTPTAAGFTINGALATAGVATLPVARRVLLTTTANESAKTVLLSGTDVQGRSISETVTGPNIGTVQTNLDFLTVTSAVPSVNFTGAATLGTNGVGSSQILPLDHYGWPDNGVQTVVTGTVNYTVQYTLDDPYQFSINPLSTPTGASTALNWFDFPDPNFVGATTSQAGGSQFLAAAVRVLINSGTGTVTLTVLQPGITG